MPNGVCSQCNNPLPIALNQSSVDCPVCGLTNHYHDEQPPKKPSETKKKKSLISVFFSTVAFVLAMLIIAHQQYGIEIFKFTLTPAPGGISELTKNDLKNLSEPAVRQTVSEFFDYLEKKNWLASISEQTGYSTTEIKDCLKVDYKFDIGNKPNKYWTLRFTCPKSEDGSYKKSEMILMSILQEFEGYKMILRSKL
ncbi:hypothetical protein HR060_11620 [Catenovulum sp. SM1970]|uniref:hypothetical protein n=1 Tax=Marinifaba aquimaris TaxID=2741323 RepID=UPI001573071D|nr:hypothetical protein [Marinifaba aquimaris]NTS77511.1 hypothetical protein [Marinifaba aquimaris]